MRHEGGRGYVYVAADLTCCGQRLGRLVWEPFEDEPWVDVEPYGLFVQPGDSPRARASFVCPTCASNTVLTFDTINERMRALRDAVDTGRSPSVVEIDVLRDAGTWPGGRR
jgi:hypothetical protein